MRQKRSSDPPRPTTSIYPISPTASRTTRASSIFPYSTARPPTNYSQRSFLQDAGAPPVPRRSSSPLESPFGGIIEEDEEGEGETPLYARSDWDASTARSPQTGGNSTAWSRSSFADMTTAPLTTGRVNTLGDIREEDEEYIQDSPSRSPAPILATGYVDGLTMSPGMMTATSRTSSVYTVTTGAQSHFDRGGRRSGVESGSHAQSGSWIMHQNVRRSTLPSILDLEHLAQPSARPEFRDVNRSSDPFADHQLTGGETTQARPGDLTLPSPSNGIQALSPDLLTPTAHNRLGRMSVAPARYTPEQRSPNSLRNRSKSPTATPNPLHAVASAGGSGIVKMYLTWRPFLTAALSLVSALLLTISLQNNQGSVSTYLEVKEGVFATTPPNVGAVGLGVSGWCPLDGVICEAYDDGDFINANGNYRLPGDPLLTSLGDLLTALTAVSWLHALYVLTTAFLHFYLFFVLSIPFDHLTSTSSRAEQTDETEDNVEQREVDIRVRCERPPFEGYIWVWWAWWGHRRAPVGHILGFVIAVLAISSFAIAFLFKQAVADATSQDGVTLGTGTYIPLVAFVFALDPLISSMKYLLTLSSSWSTFLHPPSPSPAAIFLPLTHKPMTHTRDQSGKSFFAPRKTMALSARPKTFATSTDPPPIPGADLDDETRRWLIAYPEDPELVPLIAALRGGKSNDDFILSDVGLLYLRPEGDSPALLVPPAGGIRKEVVEDTHHEPDVSGNSGHLGYDAMIGILNETFWWNGMEGDVKRYLDGCACKSALSPGSSSGESNLISARPGATPVPFTGVTSWTEKTGKTGYGGQSAMAAEMAFAERKADEEAERDKLG